MATIGDVTSWVTTTMLKRADITSEVENFAVKTYKIICSKVPFTALRQLSSEITLSAGVSEISIATITDLCGIHSVMLFKNGVKQRRLTKSEGRQFDQYRVGSSAPASYARRANILELFPIPNTANYTIKIRYWRYPTIEATVANTVLAYPQEWELLHEYETLYHTYILLENYEAANALMYPRVLPSYPSGRKTTISEVGIIPRLWNELLTAEYQKDDYDSDFGIIPMTARYTGR